MQRQRAMDELKQMSEKINNDTMEVAKMKAQGRFWHTLWVDMKKTAVALMHPATPRAKRRRFSMSGATSWNSTVNHVNETLHNEHRDSLSFEDFAGWFVIWG